MPDRYVREGLLHSPSYNALALDTREFFVRLLLACDDFGCFDGREHVIAGKCYPHPVDLTDISRMVAELHHADMIVKYSNRGQVFLAITKWSGDLRGSRRFPAPPINVDVEGLNPRGKFGKEIGWQNPRGSDPTSILLDTNSRAVAPQPPEWRPPNHMRPVTRTSPVTRSVAHAASDTQPMTGGTSHAVQTPDVRLQIPVAGGGDAGRSDVQPVTATAPANGELIEFNGKEFTGLTEEKRLAWQGMFYKLAIPDEVDKAAAWLAANHGEREAIRKLGEGFEAFIFRWLARSERGMQVTYKGAH